MFRSRKSLQPHQEEKEAVIHQPQPVMQPAPITIKEEEFMDHPQSVNKEESYLSEDVVIQGDVECSGGLTLLGTIRGNVHCGKDLIVRGQITGNVSADNLELHSGQIEGNVQCRSTLTMFAVVRNIGVLIWMIMQRTKNPIMIPPLRLA